MPSRYTWSLLKQPVRTITKSILTQNPPFTLPQLEPSPDPTVPTWLGGIRLSSLGTDTVLPAYILVLHVLCQILKELAEGHVRRLVDGVVQQGGTPQEWLLSEQHTMQAGQALLSGVGWPKAVLQSAFSAVPWLPRIIHTTQVVGACRDEEVVELTPRTSSGDSSRPAPKFTSYKSSLRPN